MQVNKGRGGRSITSDARRAQIVAATIETIAELGCERASFAKIAERAGLSSTRLISYHFANRDDLLAQVLNEVYGQIGSFMAERMAGEHTATDMLRGYIAATVEFIAGHRTQMKALLGIFLSGGLSYDPSDTELVVLAPVERILLDGQQCGEFRQFDTRIMAASIQRSLDGIPMMLESRPDLDLAACARELATTYALATTS